MPPDPSNLSRHRLVLDAVDRASVDLRRLCAAADGSRWAEGAVADAGSADGHAASNHAGATSEALLPRRAVGRRAGALALASLLHPGLRHPPPARLHRRHPAQLHESAMLDRAGELRTFVLIVLPMARRIMVSLVRSPRASRSRPRMVSAPSPSAPRAVASPRSCG